jgi:hypothetical protein
MNRYPETFQISDRAARHILSVLATASGSSGIEYVAEIAITVPQQPGQRGNPIIGLREKGEVSYPHIQVVDGIELLANLHESAARELEDSVLDYINHMLVLVRRAK